MKPPQFWQLVEYIRVARVSWVHSFLDSIRARDLLE